MLDKKLPLYPIEEADVMSLQERVSEAQRVAKMVIFTFTQLVKFSYINPIQLTISGLARIGRKRARGDQRREEKERTQG